MQRNAKFAKINMNTISVNLKKNPFKVTEIKKMHFNLFIVIYICNKYFGYNEVFNDFIPRLATS